MTTTTATTMLTISEYWALYLVKLGDHRVDGRHCARRAVGLPRRSWAVSSEAPTSGRRPWREARAAKPRTSLLLVMSRSPWAISFSMLGVGATIWILYFLDSRNPPKKTPYMLNNTMEDYRNKAIESYANQSQNISKITRLASEQYTW